jgi:esterase/lipase
MMGLPPQPLATLITFWGGVEQGFWGFSMKPQEFAASITCPVLLQWGRNDPRVSKSEEEILFKNISSTTKKFVIYETAGHESLCKKETEKWKTEIAAFLR